jgi:hypothetical protein
MSELSEKLLGWVRTLRSGPVSIPTVGVIPFEHCQPPGSAGREIEKNKAYFSVWINELFLAEGRSWWATYDPMALVITEFLYGHEMIAVPIVIGPSMIRQKIGELPHGFLLTDTKAVGPYPFKGGTLATTVILYRVKRHDYVQGLLKFVEGVSSAIGAPTEMANFAKVGSALLEGVNALLNLKETEPVAGQRIEIDSTTLEGLTSSFSILASDSKLDISKMSVENRRLKTGVSGQAKTIVGEDYVLYSIVRSDRRGDEDRLPYFDLRRQAIGDALSGDEDRWQRAKSTLVTLYEQMSLSPDLTEVECESLFMHYRQELIDKRETAKKTRAMSKTTPPVDGRLRGALEIMQLD